MQTADNRLCRYSRALIWQQGSSKNASLLPFCFLGRKTGPKKSAEGKEGSVFSTLVLTCWCEIWALEEGGNSMHAAEEDLYYSGPRMGRHESDKTKITMEIRRNGKCYQVCPVAIEWSWSRSIRLGNMRPKKRRIPDQIIAPIQFGKGTMAWEQRKSIFFVWEGQTDAAADCCDQSFLSQTSKKYLLHNLSLPSSFEIQGKG